jgi:DNA-binding CsgD family transcriptional regulator
LRAPGALATGSALDLHPRIQNLSPGGQPAGDQLWQREAELARIEAAIDAVGEGASRILVIEGPAGIGKTRLLLSANRAAAVAGVRGLSARASELEQDYPFGIARQWLEPVLTGATPDHRAALVTGAAALADPVLSAEAARTAVTLESALHGLYWVLANLSSAEPTVLLLDDAQWADESSLRLLNYLAPRIDGLALGLVIACRPPDLAQAGTLLARLLSDPFAEVLRPAALEVPAAAALLLRAIGCEPDDEFVRQAVAATGGNPFYLDELGRSLALERVDPTVEHVDRITTVRPQTLSRTILARMTPEARKLARAIAVLDEPGDVLLAREVAGLDPEPASSAADELTRAGLLIDERPLRFRHAIVRGAVLSAATTGERAAAHATAASVLAAWGAGPERVAVHLLATEPAGDVRVVAVLVDAARHALGRGAPEVAIRLLERAAAEPPPAATRAEVISKLASACRQAGVADERTAELYREAYELASDPVRGYELLRELAWVVGPDRLRQKQLEPLFERAIDELSEHAGMRALSLQLQAAHLSGTMLAGNPGAARKRFEAIEQLDGSQPAEGPLIALLARYKLSTGASATEVAAVARRAIANPQTLLDEGADSLWLLNSVVILVQADCLQDAEQLLTAALDQARAQGSANGFALACTHRARIALRRGALVDAEGEARAAIDALAERNWYATSATAMLMDALAQQGRLDEAQAAYEELGLGEQIPDLRPATPILIVRGQLRELQGDLEGAARDLDGAVARIERYNTRNAVGLDARLRLIYVHRALGALEAARGAAAEVRKMATAWGTPGAIGEALRAQAAVTPDDAHSIALLREAVAHLGDSPAGLEHAHALVDLGAALRRSGQRLESRPPLRQGLAFAEQVRAAPLAERAREELAASGLRLRRRDEDRDGLTPSEERIAKLAADGSTNPQIAQSLFLTIKTVEGHLSNAYRKLGVAGRRELPGALQRLGA